MFLNSHQRLVVPASLGKVITFSAMDENPGMGIRVPSVIVFDNDSDVDVTLRFDAANNKAQVTGTVDLSGNLDVTSGNKNLKVAIDGGDPVAFALTEGGARTLAQIAGDITTALAGTGARAVVIGAKYISIVSSTSGQASSVQILTPASASGNAALGFTVGLYNSLNSFVENIVSPITIQAKGTATFTNPRPAAKQLQIRGVAATAVTIDATPLFRYNGVQE